MMLWVVLIGLLALFVLLHEVPFRPPVRARFTAVLGDAGYKIAHTILSLVGLFGAFSVAGMLPPVPLWSTTEILHWLALGLTALGFVLLGAAYGPGGGRRFARHPMLAGMAFWALAHVLAGGALGHFLVFASVFAFSVHAMLASDRRDLARDPDAFAAGAGKASLMPFVDLARNGVAGLNWRGPAIGLVGWLAFLTLHTWLFGVSPLPASLG